MSGFMPPSMVGPTLEKSDSWLLMSMDPTLTVPGRSPGEPTVPQLRSEFPTEFPAEKTGTIPAFLHTVMIGSYLKYISENKYESECNETNNHQEFPPLPAQELFIT